MNVPRDVGPEPEESPRATLQRLSSGYRVTQAIYVAAKLGLADHLKSRTMSAAELAAETRTDADRLGRLLRVLASEGLLTEDPLHRFALTQVGEVLRTDLPGSLAPFAIFQGEQPYRAFGALLHTVRTGETAFDQIYGMGHFEYLAQNPEAAESFHRTMAATVPTPGDPLERLDLGGQKVVVDVGGGVGELLGRILRAHPSFRGVLFDLPAAVAGAQAHLSSAGVADRCEVRTGSALESAPTGGDIYVMSRVLHDWPDATARKVLENCRSSMGAKAVLVLLESVVPDSNAPRPVLLRDLMMMAMNGGRERTEAEWRTLLEASGFTLSKALRTGGPFDVIEARPAEGAAKASTPR